MPINGSNVSQQKRKPQNKLSIVGAISIIATGILLSASAVN